MLASDEIELKEATRLKLEAHGMIPVLPQAESRIWYAFQSLCHNASHSVSICAYNSDFDEILPTDPMWGEFVENDLYKEILESLEYVDYVLDNNEYNLKPDFINAYIAFSRYVPLVNECDARLGPLDFIIIDIFYIAIGLFDYFDQTVCGRGEYGIQINPRKQLASDFMETVNAKASKYNDRFAVDITGTVAAGIVSINEKLSMYDNTTE